MQLGPRRYRSIAVAVLSTALIATGLWPGAATAADPEITEYRVGDAKDHPESLAYGPDGNLWVAQRDGNRIDRVTPSGTVSRFALPNGGNPARITAGPDGALWFTEVAGNRIGRIAVDGKITEYPVPTKSSQPTGIARVGDELWFTEAKVGKVARIRLTPPAGGGAPGVSMTEYPLASSAAPQEIAAGPDGAVWFTEQGSNKIGRLADGKLTETRLPTQQSGAAGIAPGPEPSRLWFAESSADKVGTIAVAPPHPVVEYSVRPNSDGASVGPSMLTAGPDGGMWVTARKANAVLRVGATGAVETYPVPTAQADPYGITVGAGKDLWFTERATGKVGRLVPAEKPPSLADLALMVNPKAAAAGHERTPSADLPASALADTAVLQSSPLRTTPLRTTPLRTTPLRTTPLRTTPLRTTDLAPVQLSAIPLRTTTWQEVLQGTIYDGVPLHTVTLQQVLELDPLPAAVEALTLDEIDLADSPLRTTSLAALLLSGVPLDDLPDPDSGTWCAYLAGQPLNCSNGVDPATTTLLALELGGDDLADYYAQQIELTDVAFAGSDAPLAAIRLADIYLAQTPLGALPTSAVPSLATCAPASCATLADAQDADAIEPNATVATVLGLLPGGGLDHLGLGELLAGLVDGTEIGYEDGPLDTVLDHALIRSGELLEYSLDFTLRCDQAAGLELALDLAGGFRARPGTAKVLGDGGQPSVAVPDPEVSSDGAREALLFRPPVGPGGVCSATAPGATETLTLVVDVEPGAVLGTYQADAAASTLLDRSAGQEVSTTATAPAAADHGHDQGATPETAQSITADTLYAGHVAAEGDVDVFSLRAPDTGSTLRISLSHLPADYDLVVYGPSAAIPTTPLRTTPLRTTPLRTTPVADNSEQAATDDAELAPNGLQGVPLLGIPLRTTSIKRGTATESVSIPVLESDQGQSFTIQVSGYDGAHADEPYVLRAAADPGPEPLPCREREFVGGGQPGAFPSLPLPATTKTLVLVDVERMGDLYGLAAVQSMMAKLQAYAARTDVSGVVVPVESDPNADVRGATDAWDADPCSPERANAVVGEVNEVVDHVRGGLTALRNVVLVGPDDALPMGRVPDLTTVANEKEYTDAAFGGQDTGVSRALASGLTLSDDPYGDFDPQVWLNGSLYVPDVALGRLVETPAEISAQLDQYTSADGILAPGTGRVFGYDFLVDGSQAVGNALSGQVPTNTRTDDTWTSTDALDALNAGTPGYVAVNAHYNHWQGLPAQSFTSGNQADLLEASDATPAAGSVLFTMGCHAGLNVPDVAVSAPGEADAARLKDWAQVASGRSALFTGNTGFGYGDTDVVAYSERLMQHYADLLAGADVTAGQALLFAKQRYFGDLGVAGVYDAKVLQQTAFYGLPTYRIGANGGEGAAVLPMPPAPQPPTVTLRSEAFSVQPDTARTDTDRGSYWTVTGEQPQVTHFLPVEPRVSLDVTADDGLPVHGAVVEAQTSNDVTGVDPVYSQPTIDLSAHEPERQADSVAFPAQPQNVNSVVAPNGRRDLLVLMPGQTFAEDGGPATQRLFSQLAGTVYRSDSNDWTPPRVTDTEGLVLGGTAAFAVDTPDSDVMRGLVLYRTEASSAWQSVELRQSGEGRWSAGVVLPPGASTVTEFDVQLVDRAGNVTSATNKGRHFEGEPAEASNDGIALSISPEPPAGGFFSESAQVTVDGLAEGEGATVSVDGGEPFRYEGKAFTVSGDGIHVITAESDGGGTAVAYVAIDGSPPVVEGTASPAANAAGWRNAPVTVRWACTDTVSGVTSCSDDTVLSGDGAGQSASGSATDAAGHQSSATVDGINIDRTTPSTTITPPPLGLLKIGGTLTGRATDGLSGVAGVRVTFDPVVLGSTITRDATLTCDAAKQSCTWSAAVPSRLGLFLVTARARDAADNVHTPGAQYLLLIV